MENKGIFRMFLTVLYGISAVLVIISGIVALFTEPTLYGNWTETQVIASTIAAVLTYLSTAISLGYMSFLTYRVDMFEYMNMKFIGFVAASAGIFLSFILGLNGAWSSFPRHDADSVIIFMSIFLTVLMAAIIAHSLVIFNDNREEERGRRRVRLEQANQEINLAKVHDWEEKQFLASQLRLFRNWKIDNYRLLRLNDEGEIEDEFLEEIEDGKPNNQEKKKLSDLIKPKR